MVSSHCWGEKNVGNHHQIISVNIYLDIVLPRSIHEKFQKRGLKIPKLFKEMCSFRDLKMQHMKIPQVHKNSD